jgi:hypothetical protein
MVVTLFVLFILRLSTGQFRMPQFQFPAKCRLVTDDDLQTYDGLLKNGDLLTDTAVASGTTYKTNQIVVLLVESPNLLKIGVILHAVIRKTKLVFLVAVHDAIRTKCSFFQACPCGEVKTVDYDQLRDFKPLIKRDRSKCFRFILHHHIPAHGSKCDWDVTCVLLDQTMDGSQFDELNLDDLPILYEEYPVDEVISIR